MWRIPLSDLNYDERESKAVLEVIESRWLTLGPRTRLFEEQFAAYCGVSDAVAVSNCTSALELVYRYVLENSSPDRRAIIVPDITFVASASAIITAGGVPILCDIYSQVKPSLSLEAVEDLLSTRGDIAAVVIVHYAGIDAGAEAMADLCNKYGVELIEDCAHSPGAKTASGRLLGTIGLAGCFSFFSNKNIATGEGGMIIINEAATDTEKSNLSLSLSDWVRLARSHGMSGGTWQRHTTGASGYDVAFPAYNYRCTEITAALGIEQLAKLESGNEHRRYIVRLYNDKLESDNFSTLFQTSDVKNSSCHIMPLIVPEDDDRTRIISALTEAGIQTSHHYPPIHTFTWYSTNTIPTSESLEFAASFAASEITLPLHPKLTIDQVDEITSVIRNAIK